MFKFILAIGLVAAASATEGWTDCGSEGGSVTAVSFGACESSPCQVAPGDVIQFSASLTSDVDSESLEVLIEASEGGSPFLDITDLVEVDRDGCSAVDPPCPVAAGSELTLTLDVTITHLFAGTTVPVHLQLLGDDGSAIACGSLELDISPVH